MFGLNETLPHRIGKVHSEWKEGLEMQEEQGGCAQPLKLGVSD